MDRQQQGIEETAIDGGSLRTSTINSSVATFGFRDSNYRMVFTLFRANFMLTPLLF